MRPKLRAVIVCAVVGVMGVCAGIGAGRAPQPEFAPKELAARAAELKLEVGRLEAESEFWAREISQLEVELERMAAKGEGNELRALRCDVVASLLKRAMEARQDSRLRLHLVLWRQKTLEEKPAGQAK